MLLPVLAANSIAFFAQPLTVYNHANSALPSNQVFCIAVDSLDRKWIGTDDGLAVFDGTNWTIYNPSNSGLSWPSVRSIAFDQQGIAWIGTVIGGLYSFDGSNWVNYNMSNSNIPDDFIRGVAVDSSNNIWLATTNGIARFDHTNWRSWTPWNSAVQSSSYNCIVAGRHSNTIYAGANNGGLVYIHDTTLLANYIIANSQVQDNSVYCITLDSAEHRWFGMPQHGLEVHYGGSVWQWFDATNSPLNSPTVNHVFIDSLQSRYLGTMSGLSKFPTSGNWTFWTHLNSNLPDDYVRCVTKDHAGIVWAGTDTGGVVKLDESVGIAEQNVSSTFSVFPNPAVAGKPITLLTSAMNETVQVFDASGKCVQVAQVHDNTLLLSADLPAGLYLLKLHDQHGNYSASKLIIE